MLVGGEDNKLIRLDHNFKVAGCLEFGKQVLCGITVKNFAICGMQNSKSLSIFDNQLKQIKEVKLKNMPKKLQLLQDQENLMCGEWYGNIEIVSTSTWEVVGSLCISSAQTILDIAKLPAPNQYAISLANEGGLQTIEIKKTQKGFELLELDSSNAIHCFISTTQIIGPVCKLFRRAYSSAVQVAYPSGVPTRTGK